MSLRKMVLVTGSALAIGCAMAQPTDKIGRVGYLTISPRAAQSHLIEAFERGLAERGPVVGRTRRIAFPFPSPAERIWSARSARWAASRPMP